MLQLHIRPRIIRSFVGAPGPRQVPDGSSGCGSLRSVLPPFGEVQNAMPGNVANTTNFIYVVAASTAKGVIRVYLLSRAGLRKAPSAGNGGPGPASYRPSASARANRGILKSRERGQRRAVSRPRDVEFTVLLPCLPPIAPGTAQRDPPNTMLSSRPQNLALIKKRRQIDRPQRYGSPTGPSLGKKATLQTKTFVSLSAAVRERGRFPNSELLPRNGLT